MTGTVLELRAVQKAYRTGRACVAVLDDADLSVSAGEIVWLRGRSGAGKSTLLSIAGLLARPDRGQVFLDGRDVTGVSGRTAARLRAATIGFVFQRHNLLGHLTAVENISLAAVAPASRVLRDAYQRLAKLGLEGRADFPANRLSDGERQRIAVARALVNHPLVLLADEPISGVDVQAARLVLQQLTAAATAGHGVLVASHDDLIGEYADRAVLLREGILEEQKL